MLINSLEEWSWEKESAITNIKKERGNITTNPIAIRKKSSNTGLSEKKKSKYRETLRPLCKKEGDIKLTDISFAQKDT